ncbi:MAG: hypothetical protein NUV75_02005 [Gallionella sp.]|nr:hypothetical protein [Gallionella sp.]
MQLADVSLFNILVSLLMVVFGFLLNRVFGEIDKISAANGKLKDELLRDYVPKEDFIRHSEQEIRTSEKMAENIGKRFDKLDILLEAVRVKQQTRSSDK